MINRLFSDSTFLVILLGTAMLLGQIKCAAATSLGLNIYVAQTTNAQDDLIEEVIKGLEASLGAVKTQVITSAGADVLHSENLTTINLVVGVKVADDAEIDYRFPTLFVLATDLDFYKLIQRNKALRKGVSAGTTTLLAMNQSLERQFFLLKSLAPGIETVAVVVRKSDSEVLKKYLYSNCCFKIVPVLVDENGRYPEPELQNVDAIVQYSTDLDLGVAKRLIYHSYQLKKPLIGFSRSYTNAGALGAVFLDWDEYVAEIVELLKAEKTRGVVSAHKYASHYQIALNNSVAKSLRLKLNSMEQHLADMEAAQSQYQARGFSNTKVLVR